MNFIIGLGNPGDQYKLTKHNFGFWVLNKLIEDRSLKMKVGKGDYLYAKDNKRSSRYLKTANIALYSNDTSLEKHIPHSYSS